MSSLEKIISFQDQRPKWEFMVLSLNSLVSQMVFPEMRLDEADSSGLHFPIPGTVKHSLQGGPGAGERRFQRRTQAISCRKWIFCSVCGAEGRVHTRGPAALRCHSTNVLLQDLKTVLKDLLSFSKRIVSSQLVPGQLLRWGRRNNQRNPSIFFM